MIDQQKFIECIQDIVALAKINGREVTKEFLKDYLKELDIQEEQMEFVYEYLAQENIKVKGYDGKKSSDREVASDSEVTSDKEAEYVKSPTTEESLHLELYKEELKLAGSCNCVDPELYERAAGNDAQAKSMIIEQKLARVVEIARNYQNQGVALADLIQEGNIGLLLAVEMLEGRVDEADEFLDKEIENSILQSLDLYKEEKRDNHRLLKKAENLKDEMEKLSEDFGDKMTSDDIAQFTGMQLEEIQDILRMTGEDV